MWSPAMIDPGARGAIFLAVLAAIGLVIALAPPGSWLDRAFESLQCGDEECDDGR